jgi:hypothetical protein
MKTLFRVTPHPKQLHKALYHDVANLFVDLNRENF